MTEAIDITTEQRKTLLALLRRFIPGVVVWAYGSRVKWTARINSDLDLVAFATPMQRSAVSELKDVLAESDLPFLVDLHIWDDVPERFHEIIRREYVVVQEAGEKQTGQSRDIAGDWENLTLGDLGRIVTGKTPLTAVEGNFGGQIPFVTPSDMDGRKTISTTARYLTETGAASVKGSKIPAGSVMVSCIGSDMGKAVIARRDCVTNQQINSIIVDDRFSSEFVYYNLSTRKDEIRHQAAGGSAQPILNKGDFSRLEITLPPLAEQKAIAAILGSLDDKIELNRRMNATLEAMARALFQSWFVDFEPVQRNAGVESQRPEDSLFPDSFEDSAIGEIPAGWDVMSLYETATYRNGAPFKPADFCPNGEGLPVVKIAELKSGLTEQTKWSNKQLGSDQMIDTGDLLYSWSGSPDTSLDAFLWSNGPGLLNQHIFKVITSSAAEKRFVYYLLKHLRPILVETARDKQTTGLGHVTVADMKRLQVCRAPKHVLAAFDRLIAPIFDKAFANTIESQTLATLRDTLLPKLLSGEFNSIESNE